MTKKLLANEQRILPSYPRTPHLPHKPNASGDDLVAPESEATVLFGAHICVEEKIDGASVGVAVLDGHPVVRNRDHILRKGYVKNTAAKKQFASLWNWFYDHQDQIESLVPYSIYGEWLVAQHGIYYSRLPDWFVPYDLYDPEVGQFLSPVKARELLTQAGFAIPVLRFLGIFEGSYTDLETWANSPAAWADEKAEGIYIKVCGEEYVTHRFKMVREDFQRGALWNPKQLTRNKVCNE